MPVDLSTSILQFGVAGVVAWMWLTERRSAALREKQLADAHDRILAERMGLSVVLRALESSTRVLTALEIGQRELLEVLSRRGGAGPRRRDRGAGLRSGRAATRRGPEGRRGNGRR